jgi:hypothetical protein
MLKNENHLENKWWVVRCKEKIILQEEEEAGGEVEGLQQLEREGRRLAESGDTDAAILIFSKVSKGTVGQDFQSLFFLRKKLMSC